MTLAIITFVHVVISLVAIGAGFAFYRGLTSGRPAAEGLFLSTTIATSLTGYLFPFRELLPSHIVGAISLVLLSVSLATWKSRSATFIVTAMTSFYLNLLVLVVQIYKQTPLPNALEGPTQLALLAWFIATTYRLVKGRRGDLLPSAGLQTAGR